MTGQDAIIAMRRSGKSPRFVWVQDFTAAPCAFLNVSLKPTDLPEQQDWRFLVGLTALVEGFDAARVERIAAACGQYAKRVIANTMVEVPGETSPWLKFSAIKTTDTEGVMTWQK